MSLKKSLAFSIGAFLISSSVQSDKVQRSDSFLLFPDHFAFAHEQEGVIVEVDPAAVNMNVTALEKRADEAKEKADAKKAARNKNN